MKDKTVEELIEILDKARPIMDGQMAECMNDAATIASSAVTMAAERSTDLGMNPLVTLMTLRYLCTLNINLQSDELWDSMTGNHPLIPRELHDQAIIRMENQVKELLADTQTRKITVGA